MEEIIYILHSNDKSHLSILEDKVVKKFIATQIKWSEHLYLEFDSEVSEQIKSYILLKYGDYIKPIDSIIADRKPVMFVDYEPKIENSQRHFIEKS